MNNPYGKAHKAYGAMDDEGKSGVEIVVELYKGMIRFLREAKAAHEVGNHVEMFQKCDRAFKIIEALQAHLNSDGEAAGLAKTLQDFYLTVYTRISKVLDTADPSAEFDSIIASVQQVYESWYKVAYPNSSIATEGVSVKAE
ncbi:MAG: hypothetical protein GC136_01960 [Alphaproteobacteria bacterium]|nr:hypothetical protein [Alphaproteobacteria bacterium]